jgi:outer membrane protein OmpA-like peptidoglycan-associated protein
MSRQPNPSRRFAAPAIPETPTMNRTLTASALLTSLLVGACATSQPPPAALVEARATLRSAELDANVLTYAPLELKKATASLTRADQLQDKGEPVADIRSAAYIASQQAKTAMAIAQAKGNEVAIASAEVDREHMRGDMLAGQAQRAQAAAQSAQARSSVAQQQAANAEQRASGAEAQAAAARSQADQLAQQLAALQATQTERGMLVTLGDVLFEFNRAEVKPEAQVSLHKLADFLQQHPTRHILIEGHTDSVGSAAANNTLSLRRADAVDMALVGMGLAAQRVTTVGYGEEFPVADNATDTNRALNRRVEVYIAENDQPVPLRR